MSLLRQCLYLQSRLAGHRGNAPVRSVSAAAAVRSVSSRSRLFHQSSPLPSWRKTRSCWTSSVFSDSCGAIKLGEHEQRNDNMISFLFAQQPPQSKRLLLGLVLGDRSFVTSSAHNPRKNRKGFLNMKSCKSVEDAANMAFKRLDDLNPWSLSSFWTKVSQLIAPRYQRNKPTKQSYEHDKQQHLIHLNSIFSKTMGEIKTFSPKDLAQTALGLAKIVKIVDNRGQRHFQGTPQQILHDILVGQQSQQKKIIFQSIANASMPVLSKFDPRDLANLAYANAIVDSVPMFEDGSTLFDHIAEKSIPLLRKFEPQNFANMVWSFEKVRASNPRLFDEVSNAVVALDHLGKFKPQELCNILSAFAKTRESNPRLFKKVADHIVEHGNLGEFIPQNLSNTVWAFAKAEESDSRLFKKVADHIIALDNLHSFHPQALSNTVWAFSKAEESQPRLFQKVTDHILALDNLRIFKPQELSNILWAFARAEGSDLRLFKKVADHIVALDNLHSFKPQELSNTVWAFPKAEESQPHLFQKVADHIIALDNLHSFNTQDCSNILTAFAKAEGSDLRLFKKVADHIITLGNLHSFKPQELSNTVWAFAKSKEPQPLLFQKVADHILALDNLRLFNARDCSNILWAFATANITHRQLFETVAAHVNEHIKLENLDKGSLKMLLVAYEEAEKSLK